MANTKKYVSLDKLGLYDEKIKKFLGDADTAVLDSAKKYVDDSVALLDPAGSAATAEQNAKKYTDQLAAGAVADNAAAIATLNGNATTAGSVAKAVADSAAALQAKIDAVDAIADQNALDIDTLEGKVAALEAGTYDDTEVRELIGANADAIDALEQTHATDKGALETAIGAKADQTALDAVSAVANAAVKQSDYDTKVAALDAEDERIAGLVATEAERAANAESGLSNRLDEVEAFFHLAEGESLDTALDTLKEIQTYITGEGAAADQMVLDIAANAQAIEDMDAAYKAADVTLQANIDKKADATVVDGINGRVGALETASATHALKTEVEAVSDALDEYKNAHTSDYTNTQIDAKIKVNADAIAALDNTYATDAELDAAIEGEVTRANDAYAAKSLETTVATHTADTVAHTTTAEKEVWNAALQSANITTGSANGTIAVKGTDVAVKGLGSAAYTEASAYDVAGAAAGVQTKLNEEVARAQAAEKANADAIAAFVECSESEILALFNA